VAFIDLSFFTELQRFVMRLKQASSFFVRSNWRLLHDRITFSRITTIYFIFSLIHCIIQVSLEIKAYSINGEAASFLHSILVQGNATARGFPIFRTDFRICDRVPTPFDVSSCQVFWDGQPNPNNYIDTANSAPMLESALVSEPYSTSPAPTAYSPSFSSFSSADSLFPLIPAKTIGTSSPMQTVTVTVLQVVTHHPLPSSSLPPIHDETDNDGDRKRDGLVARGTPSIEAVQTANGTEVILRGYGWQGAPAVLDRSCLSVLNLPFNVLQNTKREDVAFIAFQFWVLGMSVVALLNESIPHILASMLTHMLATGWACFQISHSAKFRSDFNRLTTNGACKPINLLSPYWPQRSHAEISILALNVLALLISAFLTWRLVKLFGWQTFKRVGASRTINRVYKLVLTLSITIQLSLFFMATTVGLWIDQLFNGAIARLAILSTVYKVAFTITLVLLIPWLMTGWFAVRRELRIPMMVFLVLSVGYMAGWAIMFISFSFRWTFVEWRFFSLMASASALLTLAAFALGIICRINFGKGLSRYLQAQESLRDDDFVPDKMDTDFEKVEFPSIKYTAPTFTTFTGTEPAVPPSQGFDQHLFAMPGQPVAGVPNAPMFAHSTSESNMSDPESQHRRQGSAGSDQSHDTIYSKSGGGTTGGGKRWVIE
jgi:hypothetical protein